MRKSLRRFSGIIDHGKPIEDLGPDERRAYLSKLKKDQLVNVAMQMAETINRLWEIYSIREGVE
jgi:hypothetical protein